jgi:hypothetical protein
LEKIAKLAECLNIGKLETLAQNIQATSIELENLLLKKSELSISEEENDQVN